MNRVVAVIGVVASLVLLSIATTRADEVVLSFATAEPAPSPDTTGVFMPWAERMPPQPKAR